MPEMPHPETVTAMVGKIKYKDWRLQLIEDNQLGLTLYVTATVPDTYDPETKLHIGHVFAVPPATYDERSWRRWILDKLLLVEQHEACEFFLFDGKRPYAPHHGPGNNPYTIFEHGTDEDVRTLSSGTVKP